MQQQSIVRRKVI